MLGRQSPAAIGRLVTASLAMAFALLILLTLRTPVAAQMPDLPPQPSVTRVIPTPGLTATPGPTPPAIPVTGSPAWPGIGIDPFALLGDQLQKALAELLANLIRPVRDGLRQQLDQQANILTVTRPEHTIGLVQVQQLHGVARAVANGAVALILMVGGYNLIIRRHLTGDDEELWPLLGRLGLATLAINTAIVGHGTSPAGWTGWFLALNNALIDATLRVLPISVDGLLVVTGPTDPLLVTAWPRLGAALLVTLLIFAVFLLVALLWLVQMLVRLALLDVLLAVAPLALVLWVLPQTEGWARLWWRVFLPTLFCQFLQVAALGLGTALGRALARPNDGVLAPLLGIAVLALVLKIPGLLHAGVGQGASLSGSGVRSLALVALVRRAVGRG